MSDPLRYTYKTEPYQHQKRALAKINKLEGKAGLFMPMRTGKTKTVIDWAGIGYHNFGLRKVLIVCPLSVVEVWYDEIVKHSDIQCEILTLRNTSAKNAEVIKTFRPWPDGLQWVIVNYDMAWRRITEQGPRGGKKVRHLDEVIADWQPDLVVADEAHKLKNPTSQQSKSLMRLGASARMKIALTGTPIAKAPLDLFGLFRFVDDGVFGKDWAAFKDHYADWQPAKYEPRIKEVVRYKNLDELTDKTRAHSFRMTLADAFPELTTPTITNIRTPLGRTARRIYDDMAKEMIAELESGKVATAKIVLEKAMRLRQIASGFVKDAEGEEIDLDRGKLDALMDLVMDVIEQDEKLVVFCCFKHDYHTITNALTTQGVPHGMLTGETKNKSAEIALFHTSKVKVFVAQVQSGSLGIDLSAARLSAFYNLSYNWVEYVQAVERTLNVRHNVPRGVYHLMAPATIDVTIHRVLQKRGDLAQALIHNPRSLLDDTWPAD